MKSTVRFKRWSHVQYHTWPYETYKKYNEELSNYIWAEYLAHKYVYKKLGEEILPNGNKILKDSDLHGLFDFPAHIWNFSTEEQWSKSFNDNQRFFYLNCVMALSANLETYLGSVLALSIESNPGILLGSSKSIDGTILLKNGTFNKEIYKDKITLCLKGTWSERKKNIKNLFGTYPPELDQHESILEKIRQLRNKVGHAFGRDIDESRDFRKLDITPLQSISLSTLRKMLDSVNKVALAFDDFLLENFIGEYQIILAYHKNCSQWSNMKDGEKMMAIKKYYGKIYQNIGKQFCRDLVEYYDKI